ncbi:DUF4936 family protein [Ideonella oryzae]|uniref:DUF4936 family protein n=1 Tax=Ideonella oryzae TaxID=2937441 RepID=A0ABT1BPY1_9BURK|nr:DUF4936 family protein [Ideonella oryzae]MCO5977974.1 DUF4936 family protein [Ideonella oryzae]
MSHESLPAAPLPAGPTTEWFIYYQVASADLPLALKAVVGFQQRLQQDWPGLSARVLQRLEVPGASVGQVTLMETYRFAPHLCSTPCGTDAGFEVALSEAAQAVQAWLQGPRHVERFAPCAS